MKSESYVCAIPGKFWAISDKMCMLNPGDSSSPTKVYVTIQGNLLNDLGTGAGAVRGL